MLALDTRNRLLCPPLIRVSAAGFLLALRHPSSGELVPSPDDIMLAGRLLEAGELLGIPVVDHIVPGRGRCVSMAALGLA